MEMWENAKQQKAKEESVKGEDGMRRGEVRRGEAIRWWNGWADLENEMSFIV